LGVIIIDQRLNGWNSRIKIVEIDLRVGKSGVGRVEVITDASTVGDDDRTPGEKRFERYEIERVVAHGQNHDASARKQLEKLLPIHGASMGNVQTTTFGHRFKKLS
jgi:hypothetical protein